MPAPTSASPRNRMATRLRSIPPTIFSEMSALALRTGSVNLGQGFPDRDGPATALEAAVTALRGGRNQYAPGPGVPELRQAVAEHQARHYGIELDPLSQVIITAGATEAVAAAVFAFVEPGEEMVVLEPYYDSYVACIEMAGGVRRPVTLQAPDFRLDVAALRAAVTDRTRTILLNSPHNPTGAMLHREELQAVADVAVEHDLVVVTDEVYEHLVFDGVHRPLATFPGMAERTLTISSAGKTFSFTGWKIGWACGPEALVAAVRTAKQFLTYVNGAPFQPAVAVGLGLGDRFYEDLASGMRAKRNVLCEGLRAAGFDVFVPQGTYFATVDIRPVSDLPGDAFCRQLPERCGVVAVPSSVFYGDPVTGDHLVRFAFCKRLDVLEEAATRLAGLGGVAPS